MIYPGFSYITVDQNNVMQKLIDTWPQLISLILMNFSRSSLCKCSPRGPSKAGEGGGGNYPERGRLSSAQGRRVHFLFLSFPPYFQIMVELGPRPTPGM